MAKKTIFFSSSPVTYFFDNHFSLLTNLVDINNAVVITDENVAAAHKQKLKGWKVITIAPGEKFKVQATVDQVIEQLIQIEADRSTFIIGVGGGVVTDIVGYVAGIFMRGVKFALVPTTILAMVDAAIGGKNGIDVGVYKNMVGLVRQPEFLLFDPSFLKTLPEEEWINGFAEIIKHACIKDARMFSELELRKLVNYRKDPHLTSQLIQRNVMIKTKVVAADEFEKGERKLLNFGHTFGHAIENLYSIPHGHAVSIGMGVACKISEATIGFKSTQRVITLLKQYGLPPLFEFDKAEILKLLRSDKKKERNTLQFVVLNKIGKASLWPLSIEEIEQLLD